MFKKSFLLMAICLALLMVFSLAGCDQPEDAEPDDTAEPDDEAPDETPDEVFELVVHDPTTAAGYTAVFERWVELVEERSDGRVQIEIMWGAPLGGYADQAENLQAGTFDAGRIMMSYIPGQMPLWQISGLNMLTDSMYAHYKGLEAVAEMPEAQAEVDQFDVQILFPLASSRFELLSTQPIRTLDDFSGMDVRAYDYWADVLEDLGAVPMPVPFPEVYSHLERAAVDAVTVPYPDFMTSNHFHEVTDYAIVTGGQGFSTGLFCITNDTWNTLPEDIQQIMLDAGPDAQQYYFEQHRQDAIDALEIFEEYGVEVIYLSDEDQATLREMSQVYWQEWIDENEAQGIPAQQALDIYLEAAEVAEAEDPIDYPY